jgi:hypothetical protein
VRPQAAGLVAALADPGRGWDAVVTGEYERAFYASQHASMAPLFEHYGEWFRPAGGAGRNQDAALSPLLAVTNVRVMLARLIARSVVASKRSAAASRFPGEEPA